MTFDRKNVEWKVVEDGILEATLRDTRVRIRKLGPEYPFAGGSYSVTVDVAGEMVFYSALRHNEAEAKKVGADQLVGLGGHA